MNYAKMYKIDEKNVEKFMGFCGWIVKNYVEGIPGAPVLTPEQLGVIRYVMAHDMALGARLMKKRYILTGVAIGSISVTGLVLLNKLQKRERA